MKMSPSPHISSVPRTEGTERRHSIRGFHRVVILSLLMLPATLLLVGCGGGDKSPEETNEEAVPVTVVQAQVQPHASQYRGSGFATADEDALLSFKTGGVIEEIFVDIGDDFKRGDLLAMLDTTEVGAMVVDAEQTARLATNDYRRIKQLYKNDVATKQQFEAARAGRERAQAGLKRARFNLEYSLIRAPFDGTVNMKMNSRGEIIGAGQPVLRVLSSGNGTPLCVTISVPADIVPSLKVEQPVQFSVEHSSEEKTSRISNLSLSAEPKTGGFPVKVELPALPELYPGALVTVTFSGPSQPMIALPTIALASMDEDRGYIYLVQDNRAARWPVDIIEVTAESVMIEPTLPMGSTVIERGSGYVADGRLVKIEEGQQ